jgi:hypothetical protein
MNDRGTTSLAQLDAFEPAVREIVRHLCEGDCHTYGITLQWCESRGDCTYAVQCPGCSTQFIVDEAELVALERWTETYGHAMVCGIR